MAIASRSKTVSRCRTKGRSLLPWLAPATHSTNPDSATEIRVGGCTALEQREARTAMYPATRGHTERLEPQASLVVPAALGHPHGTDSLPLLGYSGRSRLCGPGGGALFVRYSTLFPERLLLTRAASARTRSCCACPPGARLERPSFTSLQPPAYIVRAAGFKCLVFNLRIRRAAPAFAHPRTGRRAWRALTGLASRPACGGHPAAATAEPPAAVAGSSNPLTP